MSFLHENTICYISVLHENTIYFILVLHENTICYGCGQYPGHPKEVIYGVHGTANNSSFMTK